MDVNAEGVESATEAAVITISTANASTAGGWATQKPYVPQSREQLRMSDQNIVTTNIEEAAVRLV